MNRAKEILEFGKILERLSECAVSEKVKKQVLDLDMILNEKILKDKIKETSEARRIIDSLGMPPISSMQDIDQVIKEVEIGTMLEPSMLINVASFAKGTRQMKRYLQRAEYLECELAFYGRGFYSMEELEEEIDRSIRNNEVSSDASSILRNIRRNIELKKENMKTKLEQIIKAKKEYLADTYIMNRNGHYVIAVKKEYKHQIQGQCLDTSRTGSTVFIEPSILGKLQEELTLLEIEESNEVRRILYTITNDVGAYISEIKSNMEMMEALDFAFAKGKLSASMKARTVEITSERHILIKQGRHPLLLENKCVPLDFEMGKTETGIVITGPNTGGKTVALKTIGLLSMMVQSGLHVPVGEGSQFTMHNQILCDIGDGQSIEESLSTFSAHIKSITEILSIATHESLVLLDELGSGTDPKEGMGIAIAILEALREKSSLFVATTHYPEVKTYALETTGLQNARMQFDKETLMPLYTLKIGEVGESCALYIAEKLGFPKHLLEIARSYALEESIIEEENIGQQDHAKKKNGSSETKAPKLIHEKKKVVSANKSQFSIGDSVLVFPQKEKGIVFATETKEGAVGVQIKGCKRWVNVKRVKLLVPASQLYPEGYDFSIIFESVANRKAKHDMGRKQTDLVASYESVEDAKWGASR
ncbi:MAG: DNA mismatch repair protein MutS [Cellulosilyticum sp.]|nr:DNA mismatch repair protein MutS [Cellulosilyticum sp.]